MLWFYGSILPDVIQDTLWLFYSYLAGLLFGATLNGDGDGSFLYAFHNAFGRNGCYTFLTACPSYFSLDSCRFQCVSFAYVD